MIRCRFQVKVDDYRPISWPIPHPYWCTGENLPDEGELTTYTLVAYADDEAQILAQWPEAENLDSEERSEYTFTDRFPKPDWFVYSSPKM